MGGEPSSGLGEHQSARAGNPMSGIWTMCALWAHLCNGADGTNGTGGIVNICGAAAHPPLLRHFASKTLPTRRSTVSTMLKFRLQSRAAQCLGDRYWVDFVQVATDSSVAVQLVVWRHRGSSCGSNLGSKQASKWQQVASKQAPI